MLDSRAPAGDSIYIYTDNFVPNDPLSSCITAKQRAPVDQIQVVENLWQDDFLKVMDVSQLIDIGEGMDKSRTGVSFAITADLGHEKLTLVRPWATLTYFICRCFVQHKRALSCAAMSMRLCCRFWAHTLTLYALGSISYIAGMCNNYAV